MKNVLFLSARLLSCTAVSVLAICATPGWAQRSDADVGQDRSYAPADIVVRAAQDGYDADDGSASTKTPTPLIDTPQSVIVLTRDQLDDQNVRQLSEALRYVAGISMESGEGNRDAIFIRGQETSADFFLNGLRDDAQYYRPLYNIERVEILKGANALAFGRGGGGGVINRVSKTAQAAGRFVSASGSVDTFGGYALSADVNQPLSGTAAARLNGTYESLDSNRGFYNGRFIGISPTVSLTPSDRTNLSLTYSYDDDRRVGDRGVPSLGGKPLAGYDDIIFGVEGFNEASSQVHIGRARLDHSFSDRLSVNLSGQYANYDKIYTNIVPGSTDGSTVGLSGYSDVTRRENWIAQGNVVWQVDTGAIGHTVLAGFEALRQDTQNARDLVRFGGIGGPASVRVPLTRDIAIPAFVLQPRARNRDSNLTVLAGYVQDQIAIGDVVQLIAGLRYERFDLDTLDLRSGTPAGRTDEKWSPRLGIVVKPRENLSFYGSYTQSFLPQAGEQFLILSPSSADLAPEEFENVEAGVKWAARPQLLLTAAVFSLNRSNSQTTDPANPAFTILTGRSRTRGAELQLAGDIMANWHANVGYTYLDGEIRTKTGSAPAGTALAQVPTHNVAGWTRYDITERFGLGAGVVYSSSQFASLSNKVVLPAYTRVDLAAYFDVTERFSLQANIENLFDENYYPSAHGDNNIQPARPLNASISARIRL